MKTMKIIGIAVLGIFVFASFSFAAAFNPISGVGAESKGRGGAGIASGAPGLFYNPAGFSEKKYTEIGGDLLVSGLSYKDRTGDEFNSSLSFGAVPLAGVNENFGNFNFYYGASTPFVFESDFKGSLDNYSRISLSNFGAAVSYKLDLLSIGAAAKAGYGQLKLTSPQFVGDTNIGVLGIKATGWGASYQVGILYQLLPVFSMGVIYQSPTKVEMSGDAYLDSPILGKLKDKLEADFFFPGYYGFGFSYLYGKSRIYFDYLKYDYSKLDAVRIDFEKKLPDSDMVLGYQSNDYWGLGIDYLWDDKWTLRYGVTYQSCVIPDQSASPATPDTDAIGASCGASVNFGNFIVDGALVFVQGLERKAGEDSIYPGKYNGRVGIFSVGVKWFFE